MKVCLRLAVLLCGMTLSVAAAQAQQPSVAPAPATAKHPVSNVYHGVKVVDDYRWLENWDDPEVKGWSAAQNRRTRQYLDNLPGRARVEQRLQKLMGGGSSRYFDLQFRGNLLFALKDAPPRQQPVLVVMLSAADPVSERLVVDPNTMGKPGSTSIDYYVPSLDGKRVAVSLSENGSEDGTGYVFDASTGKRLSDRVPRVNFATAGGSIAWNSDNSGFYYTRYPQGAERRTDDLNFYQEVYFHKLGTDSGLDQYVIGSKFPRIAEIQLHTTDDGKWLLASVANGDGGEYEHFVMNAAGQWTQVTHFHDGVVAAALGEDNGLYLLSRKNAPRGKVLRIPLDHLNINRAAIIVPQSSGAGNDEAARASIQTILPTPARLYVLDVIGGPSRVRVFDHNGSQQGTFSLPPISSVNELVRTTHDDVLYREQTYVDPPAWYHYDAASGNSTLTALVEISPVSFDDAQVVREFATSKDGTQVPLNIIVRKGTRRDGGNPTLLEGYGGFDISLTPHFLGAFGRVWLDQGGVMAIANLRGGGEYGEDWHKAGALTHKQNVFDDFIACAEYLEQKRGYTSPARMAILGGSNGGLLMGAALTQRPDLFRAVVSYVGIYDMLRNETDPNGSFNITEYGTVKNPAQFQALYAYSPYQRVKDGVKYPAVLFLTGENDHRVNPFHSRKMTARLQAASASGLPILLRTSSNAGHGFGTALDEEIQQDTDVFVFLFEQLGIRVQR
jgi:prolyl oligopeptidase